MAKALYWCRVFSLSTYEIHLPAFFIHGESSVLHIASKPLPIPTLCTYILTLSNANRAL